MARNKQGGYTSSIRLNGKTLRSEMNEDKRKTGYQDASRTRVKGNRKLSVLTASRNQKTGNGNTYVTSTKGTVNRNKINSDAAVRNTNLKSRAQMRAIEADMANARAAGDKNRVKTLQKRLNTVRNTTNAINGYHALAAG